MNPFDALFSLIIPGYSLGVVADAAGAAASGDTGTAQVEGASAGYSIADTSQTETFFSSLGSNLTKPFVDAGKSLENTFTDATNAWLSAVEPWAIGIGILIALFLVVSLLNAEREV